MDKIISYFKILFHISILLLIIFSLYPGSILGFLIYGSYVHHPQITNNFMYMSSNHFYLYFFVSVLGLFSYLRDNSFKIIVIYLIFLSLILEILHLIIPERGFEIPDLVGNIFGVLIALIVVLIYKFWRK